MRIRSVVVGAAAAVGMVLLGPGAASANVAWCISDPPVQVVTPGGANVTVNTTVYLPAGSQHLKSQVTEQASAASDGIGGTLITVEVQVPAAASSATIVSSVNHYQVSDRQFGEGGSTVTLYLDIPAA